jgi:hypothetical protein
MIYATGKNRHLVLALAARNAARRFLARGLHGRGSDVWSPLSLRWRRRPKPRDRVAISRAASETKVQWFPQFHFHLATYLRDQNRPGAQPPSGSQTTPTLQTRIAVDQHWTSVHDHPAAPAPQYANRHATPSPSARENSRPRAQGTRPDVARASWSAINLPTMLWPKRRPGLTPFARTSESIRPEKQSNEAGRPFPTYSGTWQHWLQVVSLRSPKTIYQVGSRAREPQGLKFQSDRAEELVWRRKLAAKSIDEVDLAADRSGSFRRPAGHSAATVEQTVNALPQIAKAETAPVATLDPSVLNRLTDDVIRRVEQRIRIERERRGL